MAAENYIPTQFANGALGHPAPPAHADALISPRRKTLTFADASVPQLIGDDQMIFRQLRIEPGDANGSPLEIQVKNQAGDWETVDSVATTAGDYIDWPAPASGESWTGKAFRIKAGSDGDVAKILYA